jgi:nifR3 family TIM-barrel protein
MKIQELELHSGLIMAPMAGFTDAPFRRLVKEMGCSLVFTEMISADGLARKRESLLQLNENEHPVAVQVFGSNPDVMAEAARIAEGIGGDIIDINMGCPAQPIVKAGAGVDLMRFPEKAKNIILKVRKTIRIPLTIKIRSGWDQKQINAVEISRLAEDCGVDAITIHPRTKIQGFRGQSDWSVIKEVKRAVSIPVIGNGDVTTPSLAKKMVTETDCDGVMVGRGALGNPWIFDPQWIDPSEKTPPAISFLREKKRVIDRHFHLLQESDGEERALKEIWRHLFWYTKGLARSASFRSALSGLRERGALFDAVASYFEQLERSESCQLSE